MHIDFKCWKLKTPHPTYLCSRYLPIMSPSLAFYNWLESFLYMRPNLWVIHLTIHYGKITTFYGHNIQNTKSLSKADKAVTYDNWPKMKRDAWVVRDLTKAIVNCGLGPHGFNTHLQEWSKILYLLNLPEVIDLLKIPIVQTFLQLVWDQNLFHCSLEEKSFLMSIQVI